MLRDSLRIQQEDARYLSRHAAPGRPPIEPLYDEEHVRGVVKLLEPLDYGQWHELSRGLRLRFLDAGHILGSATTELDVRDGGEVKRVVFTGDLGRRGLPLLRDPVPLAGCDVLITECTYGDKLHAPADDLKARLLEIVRHAERVGGKVIIPAFALGRTQQLMYFFQQLAQSGELPRVPVYVDSPLAGRITEAYQDHHELMDAAALRTMRQGGGLFDFPMLTTIESQRDSMQLNRREGPFVVISASGMCENGRVRHHLKHAVGDEKNTIVIIGFQAQNTLGRRLVERQPTLKILDRLLLLEARVEVLNGLSAHADANDFRWFFEHMSRDSHIGRAFLVHGEPNAAGALAGMLHDLCDEDPVIPQLYESYEA
jgi:metallo-beta-lactamase family protein